MRNKCATVLFAAAAIVLFTVAPARSAGVVSPSAQASAEGNGNNSFPFDLANDAGEVPSGTQRYQQVYGAGDFSSLPTGGALITQIIFRPDADFGSAFSATLPSVRIDLSTTSAAPDALNNTFASNVGANDTIVYGGASGAPLPLSSAFTGPGVGPKDFDVVINLSTPFLYNPAAGNLLMDVRNFGGGGLTTTLDAEGNTDAVSRLTTEGSGANSPTADLADTLGLVTLFTTTPAPEPSSLALVALSAIAMRRHRRGNG